MGTGEYQEIFSLELRFLSEIGGFIVNFEVSVKSVALSLHN